ncbi:MAG: prephenate dehydrogenase/arogenate dehydrogenase family protein [Nitrospirae bacterium]|nr:MAG: prephenate dehydrogenase/arogenate dehydrogenase family protein [Nitrospirota bacterium]
MFRKVAVLGVGLIGASFCLAMKQKKLCAAITGYGRDRENLQKAQQRGIIDEYASDPADACRDADLIMLSAPVGSFIDLVQRSSGSLKQGALVTDAGSVKGSLVKDIERLMPAGVSYVGGHPIAGGEQSGIGAATSGLFDGAKCIITPTGATERASLDRIKQLWQDLGAVVLEMDPQTHDRIYAAVSHLPHLVAYAMMNTVADIDKTYLEFSGQGFRDMTRIAGSSPELWRDISLMNRNNLIEMIEVFQRNLESISAHLRASDPASLEIQLQQARALRESLG